MLFLLLSACDPGFSSELDVHVPGSVVAQYSPEAPALVVVDHDYPDAGNTIGAICGGSMDLSFRLALNELGCGLGGTEVTVSLFPADAAVDGPPSDLSCGTWADVHDYAYEGTPDHVATSTYEEREDPENADCGGHSEAAVFFAEAG